MVFSITLLVASEGTTLRAAGPHYTRTPVLNPFDIVEKNTRDSKEFNTAMLSNASY